MNQYICQFFNLLGTIAKQIIQGGFNYFAVRLRKDRQSPQSDSSQSGLSSFTEIARKAAAKKESEQIEIASTAKSSRNKNRHCNQRRKSKKAKWAEEKSRQDTAYTEAKANGDKESVRAYWEWIQRYGASTKEYYARAKAKRKAAKKIVDRRNKNVSVEARKREAEIKSDAKFELPENIMIEHLKDHRDGIGWSIAALAKKRFYVRRTLKSNDSNGDMFCEVADGGKSLLKAVKQLISEHNHSN